MRLTISIRHVQNIKSIDFSVDLAAKSLVGITGKNGSGKTTLIKAIKNLLNADTLSRTSAARSLSVASTISYMIDGASVVFTYDETAKVLDTRDVVPNVLRKRIYVELPIPYGDRFNFFQRIGEIDRDLRSQVVLRQYARPDELIEFLQSVYNTTKFENLVEVRVRKTSYYALVFDNNYYLREDFFSSGEYFLISLYRKITSGYMAIFIDEIDISLDPAAQVRLVEWLRKFNEIYHSAFIFTTHSLAMMRTLQPNELFYMEERDDGSTSIDNRSYAFVKSILFGFAGADKYILTEDEVLKDFLEHVIRRYCKPTFYQYKVIYVGGSSNTADLMRRNATENFFSKLPKNVITVLDGDQRRMQHAKRDNVYCIPMESVEKDLLSSCLEGGFWDRAKFRATIDDWGRLADFMNGRNDIPVRKPIRACFYNLALMIKKNATMRRQLEVAEGVPAKEKDFKKAGKRLYSHLISAKEITKHEIFDHLIARHSSDMLLLQSALDRFLSLDS